MANAYTKAYKKTPTRVVPDWLRAKMAVLGRAVQADALAQSPGLRLLRKKVLETLNR